MIEKDGNVYNELKKYANVVHTCVHIEIPFSGVKSKIFYRQDNQMWKMKMKDAKEK